MDSVVIEGQYEELDEREDELDLSDDDSLPWLETDEEIAASGGVDAAQLFGFVAILLTVLAAVVGAIWYFSNTAATQTMAADGSTIEAPDGPYKDRPEEEERGGRQVEGTGNVAPAVAEGQTPEGRIASNTGAGSGDQDLSIEMPAIAGAKTMTGKAGTAAAASDEVAKPATVPGTKSAATTDANPQTPNVQLAAYSNRARAEQGWREISGRTSALDGVKHRVVEGQADIGTVFRLQALPGDRAAANRLCSTLRAQGIDCQVKP